MNLDLAQDQRLTDLRNLFHAERNMVKLRDKQNPPSLLKGWALVRQAAQLTYQSMGAVCDDIAEEYVSYAEMCLRRHPEKIKQNLGQDGLSFSRDLAFGKKIKEIGRPHKVLVSKPVKAVPKIAEPKVRLPRRVVDKAQLETRIQTKPTKSSFAASFIGKNGVSRVDRGSRFRPR